MKKFQELLLHPKIHAHFCLTIQNQVKVSGITHMLRPRRLSHFVCVICL